MKQLIITVFLFFISLSLYSQKERKYIREGNKDYAKSAYNNSEIEYQKALSVDSASFAANFNLADAYYKQNKPVNASLKYDIYSFPLQKKEEERLNLTASPGITAVMPGDAGFH